MHTPLNINWNLRQTHDEILQRYGVSSAPTVIFFKRKGVEEEELRIEYLMGKSEFLARMNKLLGESGTAFIYFLGKKSEMWTYHLMRALPQVNPPPNTGMHTRSPSLTLPSLTASSREMAQDAEEMLPYLSKVT